MRLDEKLGIQFEGYTSSGKKVGVFSEVYPALRLLEFSGSISVNSSTTKMHSAKGAFNNRFPGWIRRSEFLSVILAGSR